MHLGCVAVDCFGQVLYNWARLSISNVWVVFHLAVSYEYSLLSHVLHSVTLYVLHLCLFLIHFLLQGLAYNSVWNDLVKTQAVSPCCNNAPACTTAYFRIHRLHLSESCHVDGTGKPASVSPYPACFDLANKYTCTRKNFGNNIMLGFIWPEPRLITLEI